MPIFIIRHALKETNRNLYPEDDLTPLAKGGMRQLPVIGRTLSHAIQTRGFAGKRVFLLSADQLRSKQTRDGTWPELADFNPVTLSPTRNLNEISRGEAYSLSTEERHARWPIEMKLYDALKRKPKDGKPLSPHALLMTKLPGEGAEFVNDVFKRTAKEHKKITQLYSPDDVIIIFTSNIPARSLAMQLLNETPDWYLHQATPKNGSIRLLEGKSWDNMEDKGYLKMRKSHAELIGTRPILLPVEYKKPGGSHSR